MLRKTKITIAALVLATALVAGTGVYGVTAAFAGSSPNELTALSTTATTAPNPATTQELRTQILEMLKDHMGLTGSQADQLATTMAEQMQTNGITNASEMLKKCTESGGMMNGMMNGQGGANMMNGMMNGQGGSNMMNGTSHADHHRSTSTTSSQT